MYLEKGKFISRCVCCHSKNSVLKYLYFRYVRVGRKVSYGAGIQPTRSNLCQTIKSFLIVDIVNIEDIGPNWQLELGQH